MQQKQGPSLLYILLTITIMQITHNTQIQANKVFFPCENYQVWVLCNDCNKVSEVDFHVIGHKCSHCNSYNTRSTSRPADLSGSSSPSTSDSSENNPQITCHVGAQQDLQFRQTSPRFIHIQVVEGTLFCGQPIQVPTQFFKIQLIP